MKRFILRLLLTYTILSVIGVAGIIIISTYEQREDRYPRKTLYVVNMTGDSISVYISGAYTKAEKREMKDKPDEYMFAEDAQNMPYHWEVGVERQAVRFRIPHKQNTEIEFPADFKIHIQSANGEIILDKAHFEHLINGDKYGRNWWVIYVQPYLLNSMQEGVSKNSFMRSEDSTNEIPTKSIVKKKTVLILPCSNGYGVEIPIEKYIEKAIKKDSTLKVLPFPYKKLQHVLYYGVYDKKYCLPITEKVDADYFIMSVFTCEVLW